SPQAPNSTPTTASNAQIAGKAPGGRARSTSKHFSTSVEAHGHGEEADGAAPLPSVHPLRNTWVFWFRQQRTPGTRFVRLSNPIHLTLTRTQVESLWALTTHLSPPSALAPTTDYLLFHAAVQRPVWEDPLNITGGKWIIRLRKGVADRVWEALVCAVAGEAFAGWCARSWEDDDSHAEAGGEGTGDAPEICGCTISVRQSEDIISLWNRVDDVRVRRGLGDTLRTVLGLPAATVMEYKSNNDSMQDKSSFRNSAIEPGAGGGGWGGVASCLPPLNTCLPSLASSGSRGVDRCRVSDECSGVGSGWGGGEVVREAKRLGWAFRGSS
ncbi:eukaryotic translation initiation factor 4E member 2, partial [Mycena olivaceomarginata]